MNDPLEGTPVRDKPGTVRGGGDDSGPWVRTGGTGTTWVSLMTGEAVSDWVMHTLGLPVVGTVPGSHAENAQRKGPHSTLDSRLGDLFMSCARDYLGSVDDDTDDEVVGTVLDVVHAVAVRAREQGQPLMMVARGDADPEPPLAQCGERGGPVATQCVYDALHPGPHSFEPTHDGKPRCGHYVDRPCVYPMGHICQHSSAYKCQARSPEGRLCDLSDDHVATTPHDWMETFGNPSITCQGFNRRTSGAIAYCMFRRGHTGPCSFDKVFDKTKGGRA